MIKALALIAIALMTNGCVVAQRSQTPSYADVQAESLNQALQNGQISRSDYYARMNELQALAQQDQARRQQAAIAIYGQMQQQSRLQQQLQAQQQQKYLDSIRAIQQQQQTPSAPAGQSEWIF